MHCCTNTGAYSLPTAAGKKAPYLGRLPRLEAPQGVVIQRLHDLNPNGQLRELAAHACIVNHGSAVAVGFAAVVDQLAMDVPHLLRLAAGHGAGAGPATLNQTVRQNPPSSPRR